MSTTLDEAPAPTPDDDKLGAHDSAWILLTVVLSGFALIIAVWGVSLGWRAVDESKGGVASSDTGETVMVAEKEFHIDDATIGAGGTLHVMNDGSTPHNLYVEGTDLKTPDLDAGASEPLKLGDLKPGTYKMFCNIAGHRSAGMEATLTVGAAGTATASPSDTTPASGATMDYAAMTKAMVDSMAKFPATTKGTGNQVLQPTTVTPDGTKVFDLVAKIVDWEKAPGEVVKAWTYNGTVPAPTIRLNVGDKVEFRLKNELPVGTDLHLHGLNVDNQYDGVAPLTQDLIEPGATFTYKYTADEVAVAMYHPHFMSQVGMPNGMFGTILVGEVPTHAGETISGKAIPADVRVSQELPMVLNDSGVIGLSLNGKSFPATAPIVAKTGDWVLFHYFNEGSQTHPMHLHQFDQIVVAKDGFPLDHPYAADVINVGPGERYSVLVHLDKKGTWVWHCHILPHVEDDDGMFGMVTAVVVQ